MMVRLKWYLDPPTTHQLKKKVVKVGPPLTKILDPRMQAISATCTEFAIDRILEFKWSKLFVNSEKQRR